MHKVLHLLDSAGLYGAETMILNLSREQGHSTLQPVVGAIAPIGTPDPEIVRNGRELGLPTHVFHGRSRFDLRLVAALHRYLKSEHIDILHSHGYKASVIGFAPTRLLRCPMVITCHLWFARDDLKLQLYHWLETLVMRQAAAVVGVSDDIAAELRARGIPDERVHTIHNGIDPAHYRPYSQMRTREFLSTIDIRPEDIVVGSAGRLHPQKDFPTLLKALAKVRQAGIDVKGLILGEGPGRQMLERLAAELGLDGAVTFAGYREDIFNLMERLDLFVLPSIMEGLPMVLLEAMASRRAIVATPVGAVPTVLRDNKEALFFPAGDVESLTERILRLIRDSDLRCRLGTAARQHLEEAFSSRKMAARYMDLYRTLLR